MGTDVFLVVYRGLVFAGFTISLIAWLGYTVLTPWYKYILGRIVWALLFSITLVLSVSVAFSILGNFNYRREFAVGAFFLFDVVLLVVAYGIYTKQIRGYLKKRVGQLSAKVIKKKETE
jgi:hypothetical protein